MIETLNRQSCICEVPEAEVFSLPPEGVSEPPRTAAIAPPRTLAGAPAAPTATPLCERPIGADAFAMADAAFASTLKELQAMPLGQRIECVSRRFLGLPFKLDPLGEGEGSFIDTDPMISFEALDCMTYVETVMALASAQTPGEFEAYLREIRYRSGIATYAGRNHFVEGRGGWLAVNEGKNWIRDITRSVSAMVQTIHADIDVMGWMMGNEQLTREEKDAAAVELHEAGLDTSEPATMDYIPISAFFAFGAEGTEPDEAMIAKLPEISVMLILRTEKDAQRVGVIVAHMGFVIVPRNPDGTRGEPILRDSSQLAGVFRDTPLRQYLASQRDHRSGVVFLEVLEK